MVTRIAIIGLGLIGGSLGLALKQSDGSDLEIIGFARRPEVASQALNHGAVDRTEPELTQAVRNTDIVIIATPIMVMKDIFREIADYMAPKTIISDVGSTKVQILEWARAYLPPSIRFVGGHPMTGKETSGFEGAEADLFQNSVYCVTPTPNSSQEAINTIQELAIRIGARPLLVEPVRHDEMVAGISHLPLVVSSALMTTTGSDVLWNEMSQLAASGFRDTSRLASGSPEVHLGICATNQQAIVGWIDRYINTLQDYRRLILENEQDLKKTFKSAQENRDQWLKEEGRKFSR